MNIRGLISNIASPNEVRKVDTIGRAIQSDSANDRDANGQESYQQQGGHHQPMNDDELQKALTQLQNLPAFKEHKWTAELVGEVGTGSCEVLVKDNLGSIIRRIPENDLRSLPDPDSQKGQLLKKTA